jgi:hypothetical protein
VRGDSSETGSFCATLISIATPSITPLSNSPALNFGMM